MRRWFVLLVAAMAVLSGLVATPAPSARAALTPIGKLGDVLRIDYMNIVADVPTWPSGISTDPACPLR